MGGSRKEEKWTNLAGDVGTDEDLLVVEEHSVDVGDGSLGSLTSLVVDESVSERDTELVGSDLAGEDVSEGGEGVVESLVVNGLVLERYKSARGDLVNHDE